MNKVFIIAEAGTAHDGKLDKALDLVRMAKESGADAVKFQIYRTDELVKPDDDLYEFFRKRERFTFEGWKIIVEECRRVGIEFMASVFGEWSADLYARLGQNRWKIASRSVGDLDLIHYIFKRYSINKMYVSLGMTPNSKRVGVMEDIRKLYISEGGETWGLVFMHSVSKYPTPFKDADLGEIVRIKQFVGSDELVGYSDHTIGNEACLVAVGAGARVIEKHLKHPQTDVNHPDNKCALYPLAFKRMVRIIRMMEDEFSGKEVIWD